MLVKVTAHLVHGARVMMDCMAGLVATGLGCLAFWHLGKVIHHSDVTALGGRMAWLGTSGICSFFSFRWIHIKRLGPWENGDYGNTGNHHNEQTNAYFTYQFRRTLARASGDRQENGRGCLNRDT